MDAVNVQQAELLLRVGLPLAILVGAYLIGSYVERRHFASIREREQAFKTYPVTTFESVPESWQIGRSELVAGNVVVSLDYFKRVIAGLRSIIGGRIKTYEPLLDRARREALLRMLESAKNKGYDAVINVRLETSRLANATGGGQGTAGVEMLAFGTGITLLRR
ncbi:MAG TPA: heavy metal-binding domain-containing protein [Woeseiaceae bacterium]|nr:heavy metal-binding domain-containing protein [Woeseiaceae bacterium]